MPPGFRTLPLPRVGTSAQPTPYARSPGGSGVEALGQGLGQLARVGSAIASREMELDAAAAATKAEADLEKFATPLLAEYKNLAGEHALNEEANAKLFETIDAERQRLKATLDDRSSYVFDLRSRGHMEGFRKTIENHAAEQRVVARDSAGMASMKASRDGLAYAYADPEQRAKLMASPEAFIRAKAATAAEGEQNVAAWRSEFHTKVMDYFLVDRDVEKAKEYLAANRGEFGTALKQYEHNLGVIERSVQREALAEHYIHSSRTGDEDGWADPIVALERVNDIEDPLMRQEVRQEVASRLKFEAAARQQKIDTTATGVFGAYLTNGYAAMNRDKALEIDWLKRRAPEEWRKIQMTIRSDSEYYRRLKNGEGGETEQQRQNFLDFLDDLATRRPEYYSDQGYSMERLRSDWRHKLSPADYERAGRMVVESKAQAAQGANQRQFAQAVDAAATRMGLGTHGLGKKERQLLGAKAKLWLDEQNAAGVKPKPEAIREALDHLAEEVVIERWGPNKRIRRYQMTEGMVEAAPEESGPPDKPAAPPFEAALGGQAPDVWGETIQAADEGATDDGLAGLDEQIRESFVRQGITPTPELVTAARSRLLGGP